MDARTSAQTTTRNKPRQALLRPCTWVWLMLIGLTLSMLAVGKLGLSGGSVVALLLVATLFKTQLVADIFMGLRQSRWLWRMIVTVYLVIVISMIGLAYWLGTA